jgi:peptidoglycan hydrolase CwlO-like protein
MKFNKTNPKRKFKKELWGQLSTEWQKEKMPGYSWYQMPQVRYGVALSMIVILLGSSITSTYAYSSSEVTEGTMFYPIKRNIEKLEEKFRKSPESKTKFYFKQIERREGELKRLQQHKRNVVKTQAHIQMMDKQIEKAQEWIKNKQIQNPQLKNKIENRIKMKRDFIQKSKIIINKKINSNTNTSRLLLGN